MLQAIGFAPRVEGYGLEAPASSSPTAARSRSTSAAAPTSTASTRSATCTGKLMLAHAAEAMGIVAAETIAGAETMPDRLRLHPAGDVLPAADRLLRLLRGAGQGEGLRRQDREVPVLAPTARRRASATRSGFVKIVADAKYNEILGAHMIGPDVTELLPALTLAQQWDLTADEVARNVFAHPTLSEAVKEAVEGIAGHMINL